MSRKEEGWELPLSLIIHSTQSLHHSLPWCGKVIPGITAFGNISNKLCRMAEVMAASVWSKPPSDSTSAQCEGGGAQIPFHPFAAFRVRRFNTWQIQWGNMYLVTAFFLQRNWYLKRSFFNLAPKILPLSEYRVHCIAERARRAYFEHPSFNLSVVNSGFLPSLFLIPAVATKWPFGGWWVPEDKEQRRQKWWYHRQCLVMAPLPQGWAS